MLQSRMLQNRTLLATTFYATVFIPVQKIEFLGVMIDSLEMTLSLPQEKVNKIVTQCQEILSTQKVSLRDLTLLIGRLSSTAQAVLPATIQFRYLQQIQIFSLVHQRKLYEDIVHLDKNAIMELN